MVVGGDTDDPAGAVAAPLALDELAELLDDPEPSAAAAGAAWLGVSWTASPMSPSVRATAPPTSHRVPRRTARMASSRTRRATSRPGRDLAPLVTGRSA